MNLKWVVYILMCADDRTYVGSTSDLNDRLERHMKGQINATKHRLPIKIINLIAFRDKYSAYRFEKYLKTGSGRAFMKRHIVV